jgi:hypothetical protein
MTLERSCDYGLTWSAYRYYAVNCPLAFMMADTPIGFGAGPVNGTSPICTSSQSELFSFDFTDALVSQVFLSVCTGEERGGVGGGGGREREGMGKGGGGREGWPTNIGLDVYGSPGKCIA